MRRVIICECFERDTLTLNFVCLRKYPVERTVDFRDATR
jgi:hypothetical protein